MTPTCKGRHHVFSASLSFAPGSKVLYAKSDTDPATDVTTGEALIGADGSITVVTLRASTYVVPEHAPPRVRKRLRELGRSK